MAVKKIIIIAMSLSSVVFASQSSQLYKSQQFGTQLGLNKEQLMADSEIIVKHFRATLEPLLESFKNKNGERETRLRIDSQGYDDGTIIARAHIFFKGEERPLILAETYSPQQIHEIKQSIE